MRPVSPSSDQRRSPSPMSIYIRRALIDLLVIAATTAIVFVLVVDLDLFDRLYQLSRAHEDWELDELILAATLSVIGIYIFGFRRILDQRREIESRRKAEHDASQLATVDPLTGLANRRRFEENLAQGLRAIDGDAGLALMMIDLDHFKPVNDAFGHSTGDDILVTFASQLRELVGSKGLVARVGGDEFAIIIQPLSSADEATQLCEQVVSLFDLPLETSSGPHRANGCSIGIAIAPQHGTIAQTLISHADLALYRAKNCGRRHCFVYQPGMDAGAERRAQIGQALGAAIADGSIRPFYQPIVDLRTWQVTGFEVLARWHHPTLGEIPPREFTEIAEDRGLMKQLSTQLLEEACRDALQWPPAIRLTFNLSRTQLADPAFALKTIGLLGETGFSAHRLEIEISESALVSDLVAAGDVLDILRQAGISVALDDFGDGNSSLNHLRQARFDRIKIGKSFIDDMTESDAGLAFVRAILELSRALDIAVTAEGIEQEETAMLLLKEGCNEGQGFFFGKAVAAEETVQFLNAKVSRHLAG